MDAFPTFVAASALTGVQLVPSVLVRHLSEERRRRVHSAAGGVAVAFIFLHLLPEIDGLRGAVRDKIGGVGPLERSRSSSPSPWSG